MKLSRIRLLNTTGMQRVPWYLLNGAIPISDVSALYTPMGSENLSKSYLRVAGDQGNANLDPTVVGGVAPTFDSTLGWKFNGVNQYLKSGVIPISQNESLFIKFSGETYDAVRYLTGKLETGSNVYIGDAGDTTSARLANGGDRSQAKITSGVWAISGDRFYANGVINTQSFVAWTGASSLALLIGCNNLGGTPFFFSTAYISVWLKYKTPKTEAQVLQITEALNALPTQTWYVNSTMSGTGTIDNPWDLATAISATASVQPGDTIRLRGGTYSGVFVSSVSGKLAKPITIEPYPNEVVIIDGTLQIYGSYTTWKNIRMLDSAFTDRESEQGTSAPTDVSPRSGLSIEASAHGTKIIACDIHDFGGGIGKSKYAKDCEFIENLVFHCGWKNPSNAYGHAHYFQNNEGSIVVKKNIVFDNFGYAFHLYGGATNNLSMLDNIMFNSGVLERPTYRPNFLIEEGSGLQYQRNVSYFPGSYGWDKFGYNENDIVVGSIEDSYFAGQLVQFLGTPPANVVGNSFCGTQNFNPNDYLDNYYGVALNRNSVVKTDYRGSAEVVITNPSETESVVVDVSSALSVGDSYRLRNVQNYYVDIVEGVVASGGLITIDMRASSHTVATPLGWTAPATTFPQFGCFVVEKVN